MLWYPILFKIALIGIGTCFERGDMMVERMGPRSFLGVGCDLGVGPEVSLLGVVGDIRVRPEVSLIGVKCDIWCGESLVFTYDLLGAAGPCGLMTLKGDLDLTTTPCNF